MVSKAQMDGISAQLGAMSVQVMRLRVQLSLLQGPAATRVTSHVMRPPLTAVPVQSPPSQVGRPTQSAGLRVVPELCRGCGVCVRIAPHTFALDEWSGTAQVVDQHGDPDEAVQAAVAQCPFGAAQYA